MAWLCLCADSVQFLRQSRLQYRGILGGMTVMQHLPLSLLLTALALPSSRLLVFSNETSVTIFINGVEQISTLHGEKISLDSMLLV